MSQNRFLTQYVDVRTFDGRNITTRSPVYYLSRDGRIYRVPIGTESDGISSPKAAWFELAPFGKEIAPDQWIGWKSGLTHDAAYRRQLELYIGYHNTDGTINYSGLAADANWSRIDLTQPECDALIAECLESEGFSAPEAATIFETLRTFGGKAYREDRAELKR